MIISFLKEKLKTFLKFSIVGFSGVIVNIGFLWLFVEAFKMEKRLAGAFSIEISVINNFLWNNYWTWKDRRGLSFLNRFIRYNIITILTSATFNYLLYIFLLHMKVHYLVAQMIGIALAILLNFILFEKLVFISEVWKK
ncbi:MAG: GtrA family protein [Candidatus Aminicenantia bacterium]